MKTVDELLGDLILKDAEITALRALLRQSAELLRAGALSNSFAVQDYLNDPEVKKIILKLSIRRAVLGRHDGR